jgi:hypothetical protein
MAKLLFFDTEHKYTLDGEELPSVSELCRFLSREIYGDVTQFTLDKAADRGTKVHKACEILDLYGKAEVSEDILPYIQAYLKFRREHEVKWDKVEHSTYHATDRYAGTIDRAGTVDGKQCIVDIKTTYNVHKPLALAQLNLYRRMLEQDGEWKADALYILHLDKNGEYKLLPFDRNDDVPNALLTLHNLMKKKRRKKNG